MAKSPNWTKEELKDLAEYYPILGGDKLIEDFFPGRNARAIALKASRLGIKFENNPRERRTHEEYLQLLLELGSQFTPLEKYSSSTEPISHVCSNCSYVHIIRPQQLLKGSTFCPGCSSTSGMLSEEVVIETLSKSNLIKLTEYKGSLQDITLKHNTCGHEWVTKYSYIQQGSGCPKCNKGFGYLVKDSLPDEAYMYLLSITVSKDTFIKLGITSRRNLDRRKREISSSIHLNTGVLPSISLICSFKGDGKSILGIEQDILNKVPHYECPIKFVGYKETKSPEYKETIFQLLLKNENIQRID